MSRPSLASLAASCRLAAFDLPVGSEWRHYKGDAYEIVGFGVNEGTGKVEVQYRPARPLDDGLPERRRLVVGPDYDGLVLHRPVDEWQQIVEFSAGSAMSPKQLDQLTAAEKLDFANMKRTAPRFTRILRTEVWSDEAA